VNCYVPFNVHLLFFYIYILCKRCLQRYLEFMDELTWFIDVIQSMISRLFTVSDFCFIWILKQEFVFFYFF
jgi:hypothetical protein